MGKMEKTEEMRRLRKKVARKERKFSKNKWMRLTLNDNPQRYIFNKIRKIYVNMISLISMNLMNDRILSFPFP